MLVEARWLAVALYVAGLGVAIFATFIADELEYEPLEIEAVLLSLMILLDLNVAWTLHVEP